MASKKDNSKGAAKSASKPPAKPPSKASAKPSAKPSANSSPKAAAKPPQKSAAKPQAKANGKPAAKAPPKPAPAADPRSSAKASAGTSAKPVQKASAQVAKGASQPAAAKGNAKQPAKTVPAPTAAKPEPKPVSKGAAPAPTAKTAGKPAPAATTVKPAAPAKGSAKPKADPLEPPTVPKKGPIDLAQHKSVAAVAAAVASARGSAATGEFIIINGRRVRAISTKGLVIAKKSKDTASEAAAAPTEQQIASIKTKLGKKELEEYRSQLLAKRRQLVGMLSGMEDEALRSSGGNLSNMPVHMADMGSDVYEQDFTLGMAETERAMLGEIDAALQRIEDKTFGVCQMTGKPISKARLDAKPWAKYTIEAERIAESGGGR